MSIIIFVLKAHAEHPCTTSDGLIGAAAESNVQSELLYSDELITKVQRYKTRNANQSILHATCVWVQALTPVINAWNVFLGCSANKLYF